MPRRTPKGQSSQMTYARAGVDVERLRGAHGILAKRLATSFITRKGKIGEPIFPIGHYAGLVDLGDKQVLGLHVDNVGTKVIIAEMMKKYDTIGGVSSSGIHSNGMTLARNVLLRKHKVNDWIPELRRSLGEELLEPTRIYVKPVMDLLLEAEVHGFAHITGGGFSKLDRIVSRAGLGAELDNLPDSPSIFQIIQEDGKISDREMYRTFNMGVGF